MKEKPRALLWQRYFLLAVIIIGMLYFFFLRIQNLPSFCSDNSLEFQEVDSYYRWRRIELLNEHFPHLPVFDFYSGYPQGASCPWSPGMEYLTVICAKMFGIADDQVRLKQVAASLPLLLGFLTMVITFCLGFRISQWPASIICFLFIVFLPSHVHWSRLGALDNQAVEPLLLALMMVILSNIYSIVNQTPEHDFSVYAIIKMLGMGVLFGLSFIFWRGSLILFLMSGFHFFLSILLFSNKRLRLCNIASFFFLGIAIIVTPYCSRFIWFQQASFHFDKPSLFQPLVLIIISLFFFMIRGLLTLLLAKHRFAVFIFIAVGGFFITLVLKKFAHTIISLWGFVGNMDPWRASSSEYSPLFLDPLGFDFYSAPFLLTKLIFCVPVILLWYIHYLYNRQKEPNIVWHGLVVLVPFVLTLSFALTARRFVSLLIVPWTILIGIFFTALWERLRVKNMFFSVLFISFILVISFPIKAYFKSSPESLLQPSRTIPPHIRQVIEWIRDNTPPTSYYLEPSRKPEYGVLPHWSYGNWLMTIGRRPVMTNNFGTEIPGLRESLAVLMATSESEAIDIIDEWNIRYLLTIPEITNIADYCNILSRQNRYIVTDLGGSDQQKVFVPLQPFYSLLTVRLHQFDGSWFQSPYNEDIPGFQRFRLIYEYSSYIALDGHPVSQLKVFEVVNGCRISGKTNPVTTVSAGMNITLPNGRTFNYQNTVLSDSSGSFAFTIPYSGSCLVQVTDKSYIINQRMLIISEDQILKGTFLTIDLTKDQLCTEPRAHETQNRLSSDYLSGD